MHLMGSRACFYQQNSQRDEVTSSFLSSTHPLLSIKKYFLSVILLNKYVFYLYTTASLLIVNSQLQNMFPFLPSSTDQTCIFCNLWPISDFLSILFSQIRFLYVKLLLSTLSPTSLIGPESEDPSPRLLCVLIRKDELKLGRINVFAGEAQADIAAGDWRKSWLYQQTRGLRW